VNVRDLGDQCRTQSRVGARAEPKCGSEDNHSRVRVSGEP
jgi:hypothetical protein